MIIRIVKLTFKKENIPSFEEIFLKHKEKIHAFPGCRYLELVEDIRESGVFFTYSHWEDEKALEAYRSSEYFQTLWGQTRRLFAEPAEAWSLNRKHQIH